MSDVKELQEKMTTEWTTANLDSVLKYFVDGFSIPDGKELWNYVAYVDIAKGKVVFHLYFQPTPNPPHDHL